MTTHDFTLCTVPHTGAHFIIGLLETVGLQSSIDYGVDEWGIRGRMLPLQSKFLILARDPYLTALRYIYNGEPMENVAKTWKVCFANLYNIDYFIIDIGCRKEDRLEHICDAMKFLNIDFELHMEKLKSYIEAWKPLNTSEEFFGVESEEGNKAAYLATGELPEGHDWGLLDEAVEWYKSLPTNDYV